MKQLKALILALALLAPQPAHAGWWETISTWFVERKNAALCLVGIGAACTVVYKLTRCNDIRNINRQNYLICPGVNLEKKMLTRADLKRANLKNANLQRANLTRAELQEAILAGANLMNANLDGADLTDADLRGADLRGTTFDGATLTNAKLQNALFDKASGIVQIGKETIDIQKFIVGKP